MQRMTTILSVLSRDRSVVFFFCLILMALANGLVSQYPAMGVLIGAIAGIIFGRHFFGSR